VRACVIVCVCVLLCLRLVAVFSMWVYVLSVFDHVFAQTYQISVWFGPDQNLSKNL